MMKKSLTLSLIGIAFIVTSCKDKENIQTNNDVVTKKGILVDDFSEFKRESPANIKSVAIDDNVMSISVSYSGGCKEHEFSLLGMRYVGKSLPPVREIMLYHNSNEDHCRELIEEDLEFDITPFAFDKGQEIKLNLKGWKESISYTLE